jgi:hypothetical protein
MGLIVAVGSITVAACGGGERQDLNEPEGEFPVAIVKAAFPPEQRLAQTSELLLSVRNDGDETIPDLAVTINTGRQADAGEIPDQEAAATEGEEAAPIANESFSVISEQPGLAIPSRPVWVLEEGFPKLAGETASAGAEAAQTNTFAFGELEPGETIEIVWEVTAVQPGSYTVAYEVAAGLQGKAVAVADDGGVPGGGFVVRISDVAAQTHVAENGKIVPIEKSDVIGQAGSYDQVQQPGE